MSARLIYREGENGVAVLVIGTQTTQGAGLAHRKVPMAVGGFGCSNFITGRGEERVF
jgi:hypothetical protein